MRFFFFVFLLSVAGLCHASVVEESLSTAIRNEQVGRVRMLLQNNPRLDHVGREGSFLWQALFSSDGFNQDIPPQLTDVQREISDEELRLINTFLLE